MTATATLQLGMGWFPEQPGGLNRYVYELVRALRAAGDPVRGFVTGTAAVRESSDGAVEAFAPANASLVTRWLDARQHAARALRADPSLLPVAHFALYVAPLLGLLRDRPLVMHFHGPWALEGTAEGQGRAATTLKHFLERTVYARASRAIVLSQAFGALLHERYGVPEDRIAVVPGGADTRRFGQRLPARDARARLEWPQDRPIVLAVRRLKRRMGLDRLLLATKTLVREVPDVLVIIGGRGDQGPLLERQVRELGLERHVRLAGYLPDALLPTAYQAADCTVVPSVALEGFGLIAVESLAAGTPVLVTPVGGLPEVVTPLAPELVLADTTPEAIAAGLADALTGRLRLPSADQCRAFAAEHYDWAVIAGRLRTLYQEAA